MTRAEWHAAVDMAKATYTYGTTPPDVIAALLKEELGDEPYHITAGGRDAQLIRSLVNQGIDSHLEAITSSTFDRDHNGSGRMECEFSHPDLLVLLRRCTECDNEDAMSLRTSILGTLGIEEL